MIGRIKRDDSVTRSNFWLATYIKRLALVVLALGIFGFGVGVGDGRIVINRGQSLPKNLQSGDLPADLDYSSVEQIYDSLKSNYDGKLDATTILDGLKEGVARSSGDPYTEYFNPTAAKEFDEDLNGTFTGIGAELGKDKNAIVIIAPIAGFPAEKAGLKPKDIIAEIDGKSAYDLTISAAVKLIRGPKDTKVTLKVIREGQSSLTVEITRDQISLPSVESKILDGNIGYLKISRFAEDTAGLATAAAKDFKSKNVKGVILDVRGDPGGLLDAAVDLSSLWLEDNKTVLQEKRGDVVVRTYKAKGAPELAGIPTAVLMNEGSASASEITAGALKDNDVATLFGTKSYGKGSVQQLVRLSSGGILKVTIARWYTPNGKNIDKEGIEPDKKIERSDDDFKNNRDPQLDAALEFLKK